MRTCPLLPRFPVSAFSIRNVARVSEHDWHLKSDRTVEGQIHWNSAFSFRALHRYPTRRSSFPSCLLQCTGRLIRHRLRSGSIGLNPTCCNSLPAILRFSLRHQRSGEERACPAELVRMVISNRVENGGLCVGGWMYRDGKREGTCERKSARSQVKVVYPSPQGNAVLVKLSRQAEPTLWSILVRS